MKSFEQPYASDWLPFDITDGTVDATSPEFIMRLSAIRRGVANFIRIMTGREIPVQFSTGKQSYSSITNGEFVVLSASDDPSTIDANVGVALHEASHLLYSRNTDDENSIPLFEFLADLHNTPLAIVPTDLIQLGETLKLLDTEVISDVQMMLNIMEDRRLDQLMYQKAIGYRPYYDAMYAMYWQSEKNAALITDEITKVPTVENYRFHVCYMTNRNANPDALPGLRAIWNLIDISKLDRFVNDTAWQGWRDGDVYRLKVLPDMVATAIKAITIIYENAIPQDSTSKRQSNNSPYDPDNLDLGPSAGNAPTAEDVERVVEDMQKKLNGDIIKDAISESMASQLDALDESHASLKTVGNGLVLNQKPRVIIYKKLTANLLQSPNFPFTGYCVQNDNSALLHAITDGFNIGAALAHQVRVIADETKLIYTRQSHGLLDKRLLSGLGYGAEQVFSHSVLEKHAAVLVHLTVDSSTSMAGGKWANAIKLCAALAKMAERIRNIDLVISFRTSCTSCYIHVLVAYDSRIDNISKLQHMFGKLRAEGGTPEGLAFEAIQDMIISDHKGERRFFVNISDGHPEYSWGTSPHYESYSGAPAIKHTATQVQTLKKNGIHVLSYFVDEGRILGKKPQMSAAFKKMYGTSAECIDPASVIDIARTLNKLFLTDVV